MSRFSLQFQVVVILCFAAVVARAQQGQLSDSVSKETGRIDVLAVAHELGGTTYRGFTYGSNFSRKQIDCTQFIQKVIEAVLRRDLTEDESKAVLIAGLPDRPNTLDSLVAHRDERTKGVAYALTEVLPIGREIPPDSAQPGDLIQYWLRSSSGHYKGHAAVLESVDREDGVLTARLYGSHKTLGRIGIACDHQGSQLRIKLTGGDRRVYIVRIESTIVDRK